MRTEEDVIEVAWRAGKAVWVKARGNPAMLVTGVLVAGTLALSFGGFKYGRVYGTKLLDYLGWD